MQIPHSVVRGDNAAVLRDKILRAAEARHRSWWEAKCSNIRTYKYCGLKIMKVLELWYAAEFADISGVARTASSLRSASGSSCGLRASRLQPPRRTAGSA